MARENPTLNLQETAEALSVSPVTVKRMVKAGKIKPLDLQVRRLIFSRLEVERVAAGGVAPSAHAAEQQVS